MLFNLLAFLIDIHKPMLFNLLAFSNDIHKASLEKWFIQDFFLFTFIYFQLVGYVYGYSDLYHSFCLTTDKL